MRLAQPKEPKMAEMSENAELCKRFEREKMSWAGGGVATKRVPVNDKLAWKKVSKAAPVVYTEKKKYIYIYIYLLLQVIWVT